MIPLILPRRFSVKEEKELTKPDGTSVTIRVRKHKPRNCSAVRRICIICQDSVIHKNDSNYESKICKSCSL